MDKKWNQNQRQTFSKATVNNWTCYFRHFAECSLHFIGCWFMCMRSSDAW